MISAKQISDYEIKFERERLKMTKNAQKQGIMLKKKRKNEMFSDTKIMFLLSF